MEGFVQKLDTSVARSKQISLVFSLCPEDTDRKRWEGSDKNFELVRAIFVFSLLLVYCIKEIAGSWL